MFVHNFLTPGGYSVQLIHNNPFGRIPIDQTIERAVNKFMQTAEGTHGFSLKVETINKYNLTPEYRSYFLRYFDGDLIRPIIQQR